MVNQGIMSVSSSYPHLKSLPFADSSTSENRTIDIPIGAEHYCRFIYRNVIRGKINEPIAVESLFGWVLTGFTIKFLQPIILIHLICLALVLKFLNIQMMIIKL